MGWKHLKRQTAEAPLTEQEDHLRHELFAAAQGQGFFQVVAVGGPEQWQQLLGRKLGVQLRQVQMVLLAQRGALVEQRVQVLHPSRQAPSDRAPLPHGSFPAFRVLLHAG